MKRNIFLLLAVAVLAACQDGKIAKSNNADYEIYPDYKDVTIPCNVAPMNFSVKDSTDAEFALQIESNGKTLWVDADDRDFQISSSDWQDFVRMDGESKDTKTITFTLAKMEDGEWVGGKPFNMTVVKDSIDDYLTYRLVPPGYISWYKMGIYQHQISTSEESVILENSHLMGACMNCHTIGSQRSDRSVFHLRTYNGGTYLQRGGKVERLDTKTDSTISAFVYPGWHPNGKHIAFSTNKTNQVFHTANAARVEVIDKASDVVVYNADKHEAFSSPLLKDSLNMQTFPSFSPDGKWLYYCSAPLVNKVSLNFDKAHYSLCRIAFDAEKEQFGDKVDTVYSAYKYGRSISFPRVSPDGKWLIATLHNYGNFSIWHSDAELIILPLDSAAASVNATDAPLDSTAVSGKEGIVGTSDIGTWTKFLPADWGRGGCSYHSWSSNSRWLVFSSRRDDGLYTRPYFTYVDANGKAHKPFMLPQENPRQFYLERDFSYNVPEFMTSEFPVPMRELLDCAHGDSISVTYRK